MDIFIKRIKELREEYGLSQKELSSVSGISQSGISMLESGVQKPSITSAISLAKVFKVSLDYLVGISDSERPVDISDTFSDNEKELIFLYRKLSEGMKKNIFEMIYGLSGSGSASSKKNIG